MKTLKKLNNGNLFPIFGLGTWRLNPNDVNLSVKTAIKSGYTLIDTAWIYDNEKEIGSTLQELYKEKICKRKDLYLTSKLWNTFHHPDRIEEACKKSLKDLQTDYLDLYLIHWPIALEFQNTFDNHKDKNVPKDNSGKTIFEKVSIQETWRGMEKLVEKGLVKSIGVANFNTIALHDLFTYCKIPPTVNQCELHPYLTQENLVEICQEKNVLFQAYGSLGSGNQEIMNESIIIEISKKYKKTPAQILLRWGIEKGFSIIPKSTNPSRVIENSKFFDFKLEKEEIEKISTLNRNQRFVLPKSFGINVFS